MTRFGRRCSALVALVACITLALFSVSGEAPATQPSPIAYREDVRTNPPLHLHFLTVDLTDPRVSIRVVRAGDDPDGAGPWQSKIDTVRNIATRANLQAAVNAHYFATKDTMNMLGRRVGYFTGNWAMVSAWGMSDGVLWSGTPAKATMIVDAHGRVSIGRYARLPSDAREVVGSAELLLMNGKNIAVSPDLAPRTAIGVDRAGKKLVMLVVDGRRDDFSVGLTGPQLADELAKQGCTDALMLDGGGSSTMVFRDPKDDTVHLMNHPSDGHDLPMDLSIERPVADVVGVTLHDARRR